MNKNPETKEIQNCDEALNDLECRTKENFTNETDFYNYERDENGDLFAVVNGVKLDIAYKNPDDLIKSLKTIYYMVDTYQKAGYNGKIYPKESSWSKGESSPIIDLKVNNRKFLPDTTFFTAEKSREIFGIKDSRDMQGSQKLADFLNNVIGIQ